MRIIIIVILILLLATPVMAKSMSRQMEMFLDGDISYISESGGPAGESVLSIQGSGKAEVIVEAKSNPDMFSHSVKGTIDGPEVITGVCLYTEDIHVTRVEGQGALEHSYFAEINTFPLIELDTEDSVIGQLQRRIDMGSNGLSLFEKLDFTGSGWILDKIRFSPEGIDESGE